MPLDQTDMQTVYSAIEKFLGNRSEVVQDKVIKVDEKHNLIWTRQFGDQPIPLFAHKFLFKYYDTAGSDTTVKTSEPKIICPKIGEIVLILKQNGSRGLPKCIGVLQSTNFAG